MTAPLNSTPDLDERPTLMEAIGVAANARNMTVDERSRPADKVIGLGMALAHMARHPGRYPALEAIERELVPALWKLKAGEQGIYARRAVTLFADWMIAKRRFGEDLRPMVETFALRALHEWLHETCPGCGGSGVQELIGHTYLRPRGIMARNPKLKTCRLCKGSRRALPKHGERARAFEIPMRWYESEGWARRFALAMVSLDSIARRLNRPLAMRFRRE